ncbi:hypothetical protein [Niabella beijingensis]|uniref:hypothetical protein n=1 Tax=Niabella beijingensis TaxID=2872700 RepID=UPI001CBE0229|nr:hypothetical protein [Niabella beijingensis]MBZ4192226.1 hypothetical protein [Niabella beijingensis]
MSRSAAVTYQKLLHIYVPMFPFVFERSIDSANAIQKKQAGISFPSMAQVQRTRNPGNKIMILHVSRSAAVTCRKIIS